MRFVKHLRNRYLFIVDMLLCFGAYASAVRIVASANDFMSIYLDGIPVIIATVVIYGICMIIFNIYRTDWVKAGAYDYLCLLGSGLTSGIFGYIAGAVLIHTSLFPKIVFTANIVAVCAICATRFSIRLIYKLAFLRGSNSGKRALIIGAGNLAVMLLRDIYESDMLDYNVIGLIDDDITKQKLHIHGTRVLGTSNDIVSICNDREISEIIFAIHRISASERIRILDICSLTGCKVKVLPGIVDLLNQGTNLFNHLQDVNIEDLLERDPIHLDNELIKNDINGKVVLVTGGGGSIGSELCRQIIKYNPKHLVIVDIYENTTYDVQNELEENYPDAHISVLIASVRDKERLNDIFDKYNPYIVFHAAAHKHVPLMEFSPGEAIKNNVFGTYNTAVCAAEHNVHRFVMISTDKAVNPTNVMGASKRMCEMIVQTLQSLNKTEFVAVRFGNVLGSNGSVIPRFRKQISSGGPVTVTHPDITRYFMTIPEAAQLVLQAAAYAKGGEIFVLDMGEPVKIYDLACKMISLSGYKPDVDISIKFTGLRPGEKLYEELLMNEEGLKETVHSKIFVGKPINITVDELNEKLKVLENALDGDENEIKHAIADVVPTYRCQDTDTDAVPESTVVCENKLVLNKA